MRPAAVFAWLGLLLGILFFFVPLISTFEFSLRLLRGQYSFEAYRIVFADQRFLTAFLFSTGLALAAIVLGALSWCRPPIWSGCASRACGRSSSSSRCCRW